MTGEKTCFLYLKVSVLLDETRGSGDARRKVLQLEQELVQALHKHNEEVICCYHINCKLL